MRLLQTIRKGEQVLNELRTMLEDEVLADPVKMLAAIIASKQMTVYVSLRKREAGTPYALSIIQSRDTLQMVKGLQLLMVVSTKHIPFTIIPGSR